MDIVSDDPALVVGLDFAFSLPSWFLDEQNLASASELWTLVDERGEEWLERCEPPFWGRPDTTKPDLPEEFRRTERAVQAETGSQPKSPFQIGGAGAVGTASIRGMPHLRRLSDAGFSVWPFEEDSLPLVVEIYPRLFTGDVVKSDADARRRYLAREHPDLPKAWREQAAESADALDAAVSALSMDAHAGHFRNLIQPQDRTLQREGIIWRPGHAWTSNDGLVDEFERTVEQLSGRAARPASKADPDLDDLTEAIVAFRDDRDWGQFHSLRNLAAALSVEVGELQELFLWEAEDEGSAAGRDEVAEEIADVLIYTLLFCHEAGIDVEAAVEEKLETNREKYPVDDARGRAAKYTDLDDR